MLTQAADRAENARDTSEVLEKLAAEVAELRRHVEIHTREIARLQAERAAVCCPWWDQEWHRSH